MSTTTKKLHIEGMHCSSCAMNIDFDLEDVPGVTTAQTSYTKQESAVEFDEEMVTIDEIIKTIGKTGYTAKLK